MRPDTVRPAYAGIGSRKTPVDVLAEFRALGARMEAAGWVLRSGGAAGADNAFEDGVRSQANAEIFLPWPSYGLRRAPRRSFIMAADMLAATSSIMFEVHPLWLKLDRATRKLHQRNVLQILGADLPTPSKAVLCWTPDGAELDREVCRETGGTGTAIRLAARCGIPVFNAQRGEIWPRLLTSGLIVV
jgi:hypothetical protein